MIVVIQCAASKRIHAGRMRTKDGRKVLFVAEPTKAPQTDDCLYARPDDQSDQGSTWRELLVRYNASPGNNPWALLSAIELYENVAYRRLGKKFGIENTFILSAGWGLISSSFLTPDYDITFSASAEAYKRRRRTDSYRDLRMLPDRTTAPIVFLGGKDYLPLFARLTQTTNSRKVVFYNSAVKPTAPGCFMRRFETATRTNWHYECANALVAGDVKLT
jgi:hypothetical protein